MAAIVELWRLELAKKMRLRGASVGVERGVFVFPKQAWKLLLGIIWPR